MPTISEISKINTEHCINLLSLVIGTYRKLLNVPYNIKVSLNCVKTNVKQKLMII